MERITTLKSIAGGHNRIVYFLSIFFCFLYTSGSIALPKIELSQAEQRRLTSATERASNNQLYESNLSHIAHPTEAQLYKEARLLKSKHLAKNYGVLKNWYHDALSRAEKIQLSQTCKRILNGFNVNFPLTESTIACAGWWIEQRAAENLITNRMNTKQIEDPIITLDKDDKWDWYKYQNLSVANSLRNMQTMQFDDIEKLAIRALDTQYPCAYKSANLALISTLEDFLPQKEAYQYISKIYHKAAKCYQPNQALSERFHLRAGVIHLVHGNYDAAKRALIKTRQEKNPQDGGRSLFWLGILEQKKNASANNPYWKKLIQQNPLSFFALVANAKLNRDPQKDFVPNHTITLQNRVSGGWNEFNLQAFLFDLFYAKKDNKSLEALSGIVSKNPNSHDDLHLYWGIAHNIVKNDRYSITRLSSYFSNQTNPRLSKKLMTLYFPMRYSKEILKRSHKVDPLLVLSLIRQESAFDKNALSQANAHGLMQLLPSTARLLHRKMSTKKLFDPQTNINLGVSYLENLYARYNGRTEYVLAAYNAGPQRVDAWSARITIPPLLFMEYVPYRETRNYISAILRNYYWYKRLSSAKSADKMARKLLDRKMTAVWTPNQIVANID